MLDKLKALNDFRKAQSGIKKQMEAITVSKEKGDTLVVVRGDKKIEKLVINGEEKKDLRDLLNDTMKEVDKKVEKQLRGQISDLGINIPGL